VIRRKPKRYAMHCRNHRQLHYKASQQRCHGVLPGALLRRGCDAFRWLAVDYFFVAFAAGATAFF